MAHVVGVPKRDPCQKCGLPVFLAERLTVGKRVYHRTCLKCARCSSQLTPGSFYETEVDGEYCCETCPDEEPSSEIEPQVVLRSSSSELYDDDAVNRPKTTVRSSIAGRLAFFEQSKDASASSSSKLLQKSLSDEEKSKSLKKISGETSPSPYKMNAALSSFMNSTLEDEVDGGGAEDKKDLSISSAQMDTSESIMTSSDSDDEDEDEESEQEPPELPMSLPPQEEESKSSKLIETTVPEPNKHQEKNTESTEKLIEKPDKPFKSSAAITLKPIEKDTPANINIKNNIQNEEDESKEVEESLSTTSITIQKSADDLNVSKSKSNFVTKDNTEPDEQMRTTNATAVEKSSSVSPNKKIVDILSSDEKQQELDQKQEVELVQQREKPPLRQRPATLDIKNSCNVDMNAGAHEDEETTNRLSVVRARLHQFEVIANNKSTNDYLTHKTPENSSSSSVNRSSFKSDSNSVKPSAESLHQDEDKMETVETQSIPEISSSSTAEAELKIELDEVPKNHEETVEVQKETIKPVSIEEPQPKQEIMLDNSATTAMQELIVTTTETNQESVEKTPPKVVAVEMELDEDKENPAKQVEEESQESQVAIEKPKREKQSIKDEVEQSNSVTSPAKINIELYPEELNPFASDDEDDTVAPLPGVTPVKPVTPAPRRSLNTSTPSSAAGSAKKEDKDKSLNPFDSSDDEIEMEKKVKPPRPPPPKISKNPFGSESDEGGDENYNSINNLVKKPPVPAPRTNVSLSQNPTPEPTPRLSNKHSSPLNNSGDFYGSNSSLGSTPYSLQRNTDGRGSNNSLTSSTGTIRSRKSRKAPAPPPPVKELFPSTETLDSKKSSPSSSNSATPRQGRKKRPAPAPPKPARLLDPASVLAAKVEHNNDTGPKNSLSYPLQSDLDKLSDEEKALLEGNRLERTSEQYEPSEYDGDGNSAVRKLIALDFSLVSDPEDLLKQKEEENVIYRRTIVPTNILTPTDEPISHDRQLEKMKDNKEAQNRNRQSQVSSGAEDTEPLYNKSSHGKWKRRKGPAPALPIPPRKVLQMLPLQEIRHELDIIEVQQQGLEKQGVILEKMIRDRCEGKNGELDRVDNGNVGPAEHPQNSKEVEDLILQLFELVNEKNELFRRQAELMYLRRQHRLEQEQADLEYEIRVLMAQPERNKTDSDKAREEALIARLVEVVQLRNEVVECLEMDRLREAEEDLSIKQRLELHSAKREQEMNRHTLSKLSKKEKKKQKESKKLGKSKKLDVDKDADESELNVQREKSKKKKKKFLF